jgi:hypothetical protein
MTFLFSFEELQAAQDRYFARQVAENIAKLHTYKTAQPAEFQYQARTPEQWEARGKSKADIVAEVCSEWPDITLAELVEASGLTRAYVQRVLRQRGITLKGAKQP